MVASGSSRSSTPTFTSTVNSTTTPLTGSATFTGTWELTEAPEVAVQCKSDVAGTLYFDFSPDGTNVDSTFPVNGFTVSAGVSEFHRASLADNTTNTAQMVLWTREFGGAIRLQRPFTTSTTAPQNIELYGAVTFPAKTDIMIRRTAVQNNGAAIQASFGILLVKN